MRTITFSARYKKMPQVLEPTIVSRVVRAEYKDLPKDFIKKDTEREDGTFFHLPRGPLLIIYLWTDGDSWQTIRSYTEEKYNYYQSLVGQEVNIHISQL